MGDEARKLLNLEQALRSAIDGTGLSLHFQPKVCLTDQSVSGVEALVRWHHPELGSLSPAIFIPLAEGVEEEAQVEKLRLMGCNQVQVFLYHKPLPELELVQLLKLNQIS